MRLAAYVGFLLLSALLSETSDPKTQEKSTLTHPETSSEDSQGTYFSFIFSPLSYFFGSDENSEETEVDHDDENVVENVIVMKSRESKLGDVDDDEKNIVENNVEESKDTKLDDFVEHMVAESKAVNGKEDDNDDEDGFVKDAPDVENVIIAKFQNTKFETDDGFEDAVVGVKDVPVFESRAKNRTKRQVGRGSFLESSSSRTSPARTGPEVENLRRYLETCDNCLVDWGSFQCPLNDQALELKKWILELQKLLSFGCHLGDQCGGPDQKCCHRRDPTLERAVLQATDTARTMYNMLQEACINCPRDGGWGEWCSWGACSTTCGLGSRSRSRQCNNPKPKGSGKPCAGPAMDTEICSGPDCCIHGGWTEWCEWGECSVSCGTGMRERSRTCSNPSPNYCGRTCPGPNVDVTRCEGKAGSCCVDGNWGGWESWSQCSTSCGEGMQERRRQCNNPPPNRCGRGCMGVDLQRDLCNQANPCDEPCFPQDGQWTNWGAWTECTDNKKTRSRTCTNPPPNACGRTCQGRSCQAGDCCVPRNGDWGAWSPWGVCNNGRMTRTRLCNNPMPNDCGDPCRGPNRDEKSCCVPRDGNWGGWSSWGVCNNGRMTRARLCNNPTPNDCGDPCRGPNRDEKACCVPREGNWGAWSPWGVCNNGRMTRTRLCNNPTPNDCGDPCRGPNRDEKACCVPRDGNWGAWSSWGACNNGRMTRTRLCNKPTPNDCGDPCRGPNRDEKACCVPRNGNWGSWGSWSDCINGKMVRSRACDSPPPNQCGQRCFGRIQEDKDCCVPRDGNWGAWTPWGVCINGQKSRARMCDNPAPNQCGNTCYGRGRENMDCCVPRDGNWGAWTPWGVCISGQRSRVRMCDNPAPNQCGNTCYGRGRENMDCCEWSSWGPWSPCDGMCGTGTRSRFRQCQGGSDWTRCDDCPGSRTETQLCTDLPPCDPPVWGSWEEWCPCDCRRGVRSRRRQCQRSVSGRPMDVTQCFGIAREEELCNVRDACPVCLRQGDCRNRQDGMYPSCISCRHYANCTNGRMEVATCAAQSTEWDHFIQRCSALPSPSCTLVDCVSDCTGRDAGHYPACKSCSDYVDCWSYSSRPYQQSCPTGQEFNAHSKNCSSDKSPTCRVPDFSGSIQPSSDFMIRDAPADVYFPADQLAEADRKKLYMELRVKAGVAAKFNRTDEDVFKYRQEEEEEEKKKKGKTLVTKNAEEEKKEKEEKMVEKEDMGTEKATAVIKVIKSKPKTRHSKHKGIRRHRHNHDPTNSTTATTEPGLQQCRRDCVNAEAGYYQSCRGCEYYLLCTKHGVIRHLKCPRFKSWDDKRKMCKHHSRTCQSLTMNKTKH